MNKKQKEVLTFIKILRQSFSDASTVYTFWGCYWFYEIIQYLYPEAIWYMYDNSHILCKIWEVYYDITGIIKIESDIDIRELTEEDHFTACWRRDWQRVERMINKYINR